MKLTEEEIVLYVSPVSNMSTSVSIYARMPACMCVYVPFYVSAAATPFEGGPTLNNTYTRKLTL